MKGNLIRGQSAIEFFPRNTLRKGQSAIEFTIIFGAMLFLFVIFLGALQYSQRERTQEQLVSSLKSLVSAVQLELILATESSDGYWRNFSIPLELRGRAYTITIIDSSLYAKTTDDRVALSLEVPNVTGQVRKGDNIITKFNGSVYLNQ